jgi:hypothetical protein
MLIAPNNVSTRLNHIQSPWIQRQYISFKCWNEILLAGMETNMDFHLNKIAVKSKTQINLPVQFLNIFKINLMTVWIIAFKQVV